jgi:hypothetical protein
MVSSCSSITLKTSDEAAFFIKLISTEYLSDIYPLELRKLNFIFLVRPIRISSRAFTLKIKADSNKSKLGIIVIISFPLDKCSIVISSNDPSCLISRVTPGSLMILTNPNGTRYNSFSSLSLGFTFGISPWITLTFYEY